MAAVAPTAPVVTVPRLTTVAMAEETVEKSGRRDGGEKWQKRRWRKVA